MSDGGFFTILATCGHDDDLYRGLAGQSQGSVNEVDGIMASYVFSPSSLLL